MDNLNFSAATENFNFESEALSSRESQTDTSLASDQAIFEDWHTNVTADDLSPLSLRRGRSKFKKKFVQALQMGTVEEFLDSFIKDDDDLPYCRVYSLLSPKRSQYLPEPLRQKKILYKELNLHTFVSNNLPEIEELPPVVSHEYEWKIYARARMIQSYYHLAQPKLTVLQRTAVEWGDLLSWPASLSEDQMILRYESAAYKLLEQIKGPTQPQVANFSQAFERLRLSATERAFIVGPKTDPKTLPWLSFAQASRLFQVLFQRTGLYPHWQVQQGVAGTAMSTQSKNKRILLPIDRKLTPDEVIFNVPHELWHAIRGENGARQPIKLLQEGTESYLATEEGGAVLMETIMGEPFLHRRRQIFAARYVAAAMAVKTEVVNGQRQPRYSIQDIYNYLRGFGLGPNPSSPRKKDYAADIVWRLFRGTSLKQKVVDIEAVVRGQAHHFTIPECFVKDVAYFEGMMSIFEWEKHVLPLVASDNLEDISDINEFSDHMLAVIGQTVDKTDTQPVIPQKYQQMIQLGREKLLDIAQYMAVGKIDLESLTDPQSQWHELLIRDNLVELADILKPLPDDALKSQN